MIRHTQREGQRISFSRRLKSLWNAQQADLKAQFQKELKQVPPEDVVMSTRIRHKYRRLGLKF